MFNRKWVFVCESRLIKLIHCIMYANCTPDSFHIEKYVLYNRDGFFFRMNNILFLSPLNKYKQALIMELIECSKPNYLNLNLSDLGNQ